MFYTKEKERNRVVHLPKKKRSWKQKVMKCPQLLNSLVLLQFVIVSLANNDEEIDKRREF